MRRAKRAAGALLLAVLLLPGAALAQSSAAAAGPVNLLAGDTAARIDSLFARYAGPTPSPGCALEVIRDGRVVYARGYGYASLEQRVPITPATVFEIASVSKQFTALSVLLLARDGRLSLDDDVRKYVPELPALGHVTIRELLNHTSGWRDYGDLLILAGWDDRDHIDDRQALDALARQRALNFRPGTAWRYSNTGYFLAGLIVHRVSGMPLREFARERIFAPLGMTATLYLDDTRRVVPGRATAYTPAGDSGDWLVDMSNWDPVGDGSVQTSIEDPARWDANFYAAAVGGPDALRQLQTPGRLAEGSATGYGMGLVLDQHAGVRRVQHTGGWAGFRAMFERYPDRHLSVITLCNAADAPPDLADRVADVFLGSGPTRAAPPRLSAAAGEAEARRYAGSFRALGTGNPAALTAVGPALVLHDDTLPALDGGRFASERTDTELRFRADGGRALLMRSDMVLDTLERVTPPASDVARRLGEFTGTYTSAELGASWTILARDGRLWVRKSRGADLPLAPTGLDAFNRLRFLRDAAGRVVAISVSTPGVHDLRLTRARPAPTPASASAARKVQPSMPARLQSERSPAEGAVSAGSLT